MDAGRKTELEKRVVLALAGVFIVILATGPLKSLFVSQRRVAPPIVQAIAADASAPLAVVPALTRDEDTPAQAIPAAPAPPQAARLYTAGALRDPLASWLPKPQAPAQAVVAGVPATGAVLLPAPPPLRIQGLIWGAANPRAIIDGEVYTIGDLVQGFLITGIDQAGVTIDHWGTAVLYVPASSELPTRTAQSASHQGPQ